MDSQQPNAEMEEPIDELEEMDDEEEIEVTRDELIASLQQVVNDLSDGLKGADRDTYMGADDLAQNDWFFAGVSDEEGQYAITMWPAEGEEEMLRIDIGNEDDVHRLASNPEMVAAMTDDFIEAMGELDEDFDEYDEYDEEEEDLEEDDLEEDDFDEEEMTEDEEAISRDGNVPPR
jgi:hypothetical protein